MSNQNTNYENTYSCKKQMIDNFINTNFNKIKQMAYNSSYKTKNTLFIDDLINEFYLLLIQNIERNNTEKDLEKTMIYFFGCQHFKDSAKNKLNNKKLNLLYYNDLININNDYNYLLIEDDSDINNKITKEEKINTFEEKVNKLPTSYKELFKIIFINKKWKYKDIAKELNCSIYAAKKTRNKLFKLLDIDKNKTKLHLLK